MALDVLANPVAYAHVTECDAEEMKYDADYAPLLGLDDIRRVAALPTQLQLALPFLFNQTEIDAHRLLCHYTHEESELYFKKLDRSGRPGPAVAETSRRKKRGFHHHNGAYLSQSQQQETEQLLDCVLRENRLARLRAAAPEDLNEREAFSTIQRSFL